MLDFISQMFGSSSDEALAVVLGLICVWLTVKRSLYSYAFGIPMSALYFLIFWDYTLYADAFLQIFFIVIQVYGLRVWQNNLTSVQTTTVIVEPIKDSVLGVSIAAGIVFWGFIAWVLSTYTDSTHPAWDSFIASASVVAQFWLSRRYVESWIVWMVVDIAAIPLFYIKGLAPTAALYFVFLLMTFKGYYDWKRAAHV